METINNRKKVYLIGPMEKTKANDIGRGWRDKIRPELESRIDEDGEPLYIFDPTQEEQSKVGMDSKLFHRKLAGWIKAGNNDLISEHTDLIWRGKDYLEPVDQGHTKLIHIMGDIDYVKNSDFLIMRMEEGDQPCGTYGEAFLAYMHHIPIYVIQTMNREEYPVTFVGWVFGSQGRFFNSQAELLSFIDEKYKLKKIKEKVL
jgi:hypothetical protein